MAFAYHAGERAVQERAGEADRAARLLRGISRDVPDVAAAFLARQRLVVLGARDAAGVLWATPLAGPPGFALAPDPATVVVAALPPADDPLGPVLAAGDAMPAGLLALEPQTRRRARINGTARVRGGALRLETEEVFANCPKYIARREVEAEAPDGADAPPAAVSGTALTDAQAAALAATDTLFLATAHPDWPADVSHRGGAPGFVTVHDARHLSLPDYTGNSMYLTLGNLVADPRVGLLVVDWATGATLQLTGTATVDFDPVRAGAIPGAQRLVDVTVERVVARAGTGTAPRWRLTEPSPFNPPVAG